jgi:hypothetical protein
MPLDDHGSDEARTLLLEHVETFDKLEVLVHLWRHRGRAWTAALVADYLKTNVDLAAGLLEALCRSGLASSRKGPPAQYAYAPRSEELARAVDALASLRDENRLWITNLMLEGATARLHRTFFALTEDRARTRKKRSDDER